jgi:hypothetical protein
MPDTITADDIKKYLESQNDFDLELFAYRALLEKGIPAHHAGTYIDPWTGKPRQYDVRGTKVYTSSVRTGISLAIECKSLSAEFPLIVSAVPRPTEDSYHELIESWGRAEMGEHFNRAIRQGHGRTEFNRAIDPLYRPHEMVGKKTAQIRWDSNRKGFAGGDSETYDKWSQALASAAGLVREGCDAHRQVPKERFCTLVLPVLVVSDATLWRVPYTEEGERGEPTLVDEVTLFVGREYPLASGSAVHISHLHIYTRAGFVRFIDDLTLPNSTFWERAFGGAVCELLGR